MRRITGMTALIVALAVAGSGLPASSALAAGPDLSKAPACAKGHQPAPTKRCKPGPGTQEDLSKFPACAAGQHPTPTLPCRATPLTGQFDIARFPPCAPGEQASPTKPCRPENGPPASGNLPRVPKDPNSIANCAAGQQPTQDKPCRATGGDPPPGGNPPPAK